MLLKPGTIAKLSSLVGTAEVSTHINVLGNRFGGFGYLGSMEVK